MSIYTHGKGGIIKDRKSSKPEDVQSYFLGIIINQ
jgi:hypothetical protein